MKRYNVKLIREPDMTSGFSQRMISTLHEYEDKNGPYAKVGDVAELLRDCFSHVPGQLKDRIAALGVIEFENDQE